MVDSTGVNATTGLPLSDWEHVQQSIRTILTTPIGSRVMRRDFGSELYDLIDAKTIGRNILRVYAATAVAIGRWEPRFRVTIARLDRITETGLISLQIFGTYYPRGHLGDFTVAEDGSVRVVLRGAE